LCSSGLRSGVSSIDSTSSWHKMADHTWTSSRPSDVAVPARKLSYPFTKLDSHRTSRCLHNTGVLLGAFQCCLGASASLGRPSGSMISSCLPRTDAGLFRGANVPRAEAEPDWRCHLRKHRLSLDIGRLVAHCQIVFKTGREAGWRSPAKSDYGGLSSIPQSILRSRTARR
jgi:hypothetical protein